MAKIRHIETDPDARFPIPPRAQGRHQAPTAVAKAATRAATRRPSAEELKEVEGKVVLDDASPADTLSRPTVTGSPSNGGAK